MKDFSVHSMGIEGLKLLDLSTFEDERGYFRAFFHRDKWHQALGADFQCVQINQSYSRQCVLRGLHFQRPPYAQQKILQVLRGEILDVVVDLRRSSSTYGQHVLLPLSESTAQLLFVPRGFAHGFLVLSRDALVQYSIDAPYRPEAEGGIHYQDPELQIPWPKLQCSFLLSAKDQQLGSFAEVQCF